MSHFNMNVLASVVWILPQLLGFVSKLYQKNFHGQKFTEWKPALMPRYMASSIEMGYQFIFNSTMDNSAPLKYRELRVLVLFLSIILEMLSSVALECADSVYFFKKVRV